MNKILENIAHKMFFTCEKATFLIEKKASAEPISFMENIRLKVHLAMCKWCNAYNKKVMLIDHSMLRISNKENNEIEELEISEFKKQLKEKTLKQAI